MNSINFDEVDEGSYYEESEDEEIEDGEEGVAVKQEGIKNKYNENEELINDEADEDQDQDDDEDSSQDKKSAGGKKTI